jgi:hypothetical protein
MNPWKSFRNEFRALMEEEDLAVKRRVPQGCCYAYITFRESAEFSCWVESNATESLQARFKLLATEAGIALGSPPATAPFLYWMQHLFLGLRANKSAHVHIYSDTVAIVDRLIEASAIYCTWLDQQLLEKSLMPCENAAEAIAEPRPRRGYRTEVRQWMALQGVSTVEMAAKRLSISHSTLKSIMSGRGKRRYGDAALTRVLGSIGYKGE